MDKIFNYYLQIRLKLILNSNLVLAVFTFTFTFSNIEDANMQLKELASMDIYCKALLEINFYEFTDYENEQREGFVVITEKSSPLIEAERGMRLVQNDYIRRLIRIQKGLVENKMELSKIKLIALNSASKFHILISLISFTFLTELDIENLMNSMQLENPNAKLDNCEIILEANLVEGIPGRFAFMFHNDSIFANDIYADSDNYTYGSEEQASPFGSDDESLTDNEND